MSDVNSSKMYITITESWQKAIQEFSARSLRYAVFYKLYGLISHFVPILAHYP